MFTDKYGLLTVNNTGQSEENSFLWTVELYVIQRKLGLDCEQTYKTIQNALELMDLGNGLYKQAPHLDPDPNNHDTYMSHDQLTAIMVFFKLTGQKKRMKEIMSAIKYGCSYNNVDKKFRPLHPRDLLIYKYLSGTIFGYLFLWLSYLILFVTFFTEKKGDVLKTDLEIIYYITREATSVFKPMNWYCERRVKERFGNWDNLFAYYFKSRRHPINKIVGK